MAATTTAPALEEFESVAGKVDQAIASVQGLDAEARKKATTLREAIESFHKIGLAKIVQGLKADPRGRELLMELAAEPAVYALFSMHGLIRADLATRVGRVIEMIRPHIQSQGGDVELHSVDGNVVFVKMPGSKGCSTTASTLRASVEEAIRAQVPEIEKIEVVPNEPEKSSFVQIETAPPVGIGWVKGPATSELQNAKPFRWDIGDVSVMLLRFDGRLQAFHNACAHQGLPLDGGTVDIEARSIACPWHGFRFDCTSGECLTAPGVQLAIYPVQIKGGYVWVIPA
jgi:nitrite reductase/ring-hydroxylating ferredoxin subunit/Fe-S cluster biogenesis protein NfuA